VSDIETPVAAGVATVPVAPARAAIPVRLASVSDGSIAASFVAIVERGAMLRPELAAEIGASLLIRFAEGYPPVRVDFHHDEIVVSDSDGDDCARDLTIAGHLPDIIALIAAPLAGGLPKPTTGAGRAAIARLADGRVEFGGSLRVARSVLRLLALRD
jgi:hypothetical protein